jgi:cytochrome c peroxidase
LIATSNELVLDDGNHLFAKRLKMEECPTAVALSPDGLHAFVVNTLSDSVTVVHLARRDIVGTISLGPTLEPTAADRGERLFHSARLSHDSWFSCASCHLDGHTNGLLNDNFTDGSFGTAKRVLSLRGVADTAPYAWSGRFETLADQIKHSIKSTMQGDALSDEQTSDLETYLRTLPPAPPVGLPDQTTVTRGAALFERLDCARCHARPAFTSPRLADVKLKDEQGLSKYNPPSLRGISQNSPYFHDGRAATLDEVFTKFRHQLETELPSSDLIDLVAYLDSL